MSFSWFAKRQKQLLFVLAALLIVGWLGGSALTSLIEDRSKTQNVERHALILGEAVLEREYSQFFWRWNQLFGGIFHPNIPDDATTEEADQISKETYRMAWGFLSAVKLAQQLGIKVEGQTEIRSLKVSLFAQGTRQRREAAVVLDGELFDRWLTALKMNSRVIDQTIAEYIMARKILILLEGGFKATTIEALQDFTDSYRQYRLKYVRIEDESFLKSIKKIEPKDVNSFYELNSTKFGRYWKNDAYEVAYAGVAWPAIASRINISSAQIEDWYRENRDLYRLPVEPTPDDNKDKDGADPVESEVKYRPLAELKPQIEESLRRQQTRQQAIKLMDELVKVYGDMKVPSLEAAVRKVDNPAVIYERTGALTQRELLEVPGIGNATDRQGFYFHALVDAADKDEKKLSDVITAAGKGLYVFRMMKFVKGGLEPLEQIRPKVILDIKRSRARQSAREHAEKLLEAMRKPGEAGGFDNVVASEKLKTSATEFFRNSAMDPNRPDFAIGVELSADSKLLELMRSEADRTWMLARVFDSRETSTDSFTDEMSVRLESVRSRKGAVMRRELFPEGLLVYVGFQKPEPETSESSKK